MRWNVYGVVRRRVTPLGAILEANFSHSPCPSESPQSLDQDLIQSLESVRSTEYSALFGGIWSFSVSWYRDAVGAYGVLRTVFKAESHPLWQNANQILADGQPMPAQSGNSLLVASSRIPAGTILILDAGRAGLPLVSAPHGCHFSDRSQYGAKPLSGYDRPEISLVCGLLGGKETIRPAQNKKHPRQSPCPGGQLPKGTDESLTVETGRRITDV